MLVPEDDDSKFKFQVYEITKNEELILEKPQSNKITNIIEDKVNFERHDSAQNNKSSFKTHIQNIFLKTSTMLNAISKPREEEYKYRYIGQLFSEFLIVEKDNEVYFLDQHALHETIIYNNLKNSKRLYKTF